MAPRKPEAKKASGRKTAAVNEPKIEVTEITVSRSARLSFEALDNICAASGWTTSELVNPDGSLTGKGMAGNLWMSTRSARPDIKPQDLYSTTDHAALGIEIVQEGPINPSNAAS